MEIILYQPEIPQNTGNIVRTCAVTNSSLTLITPLGFSTSSKMLKRAGLDYWESCKVQILDDLDTYLQQSSEDFYFFSSKCSSCYADITYGKNDKLIFGSETSGLDPYFFENYPEKFVTIPMKEGQRCLNLANSVSIALYEALRQQDFAFC